jgi:hypothetical protein
MYVRTYVYSALNVCEYTCFICACWSQAVHNEAVIMQGNTHTGCGPLRGADSFQGKWEPAGFDLPSHTHTHTHTHTQSPAEGLNHPSPVYLLYSLFSSLSCLFLPPAFQSLTLLSSTPPRFYHSFPYLSSSFPHSLPPIVVK